MTGHHLRPAARRLRVRVALGAFAFRGCHVLPRRAGVRERLVPMAGEQAGADGEQQSREGGTGGDRVLSFASSEAPSRTGSWGGPSCRIGKQTGGAVYLAIRKISARNGEEDGHHRRTRHNRTRNRARRRHLQPPPRRQARRRARTRRRPCLPVAPPPARLVREVLRRPRRALRPGNRQRLAGRRPGRAPGGMAGGRARRAATATSAPRTRSAPSRGAAPRAGRSRPPRPPPPPWKTSTRTPGRFSFTARAADSASPTWGRTDALAAVNA